jgi:hypothetical protein
MRIARFVACLLASTVLAVPAWSQTVSFRGKVEDAGGGGFQVGCTNTMLTSGTFNLNAFVGMQVEATGVWNGSVASPSVDVTAMARTAETFEIGGGVKIGDTARFGVTGSPGDVAAAFLGFAAGFVPTPMAGVFFLGGPTFLLGSGVVPPIGQLEIDLPIPANPALVGLELFGQGILSQQAGGVFFTNPDCKTISS